MFRPNSILKLSNIVKCQFSTSAINRRRLVTQKYPLKTEAGRYIKMYVADKNDKAELLNFFGTGFIADEPVNRALEVTYEDIEVFLKETIDKSVDLDLAFIAVDNDKIIGAHLSELFQSKKVTKPLEIPKDFGPIFDQFQNAHGGSRKSAIIFGIIEHITASVNYYLPNNAKHHLLHEVVQISKKYRGNKIMEAFQIEKSKMGLKMGMKHGFGICTARASFEVNMDLGATQICELPVGSILDHGKKVFPTGKLPDGNEAIRVIQFPLKDLSDQQIF